MFTRGHVIKDELKVHVPHQLGSLVSLNSKFAQGLTIIKFLRRFGCPLTRYESVEFSQYKEEFEELNVNLVGIGFDTSGTKDFVISNYWKGEFYLDPERKIYEYFDLKRASKWQAIRSFLKSDTRRAINSAKSEVHGNLKGDGFQLGGTFLIDHEGEILYSYYQEDFIDSPNIEEILTICRKKSYFCIHNNACLPGVIRRDNYKNHLEIEDEGIAILDQESQIRNSRVDALDSNDKYWIINNKEIDEPNKKVDVTQDVIDDQLVSEDDTI